MRIKDKTIEQEIIDDYKNHSPIPDIEKKFNVHWRTIYRVLERNNVSRDRGKFTHIFSQQKEQIINLYKNRTTIRNIAAKFNMCPTVISRTLKENSVPIRDTRKAAQKYFFNESFFDSIDTQERAYFLGILYADGNVSLSHSTVKIALQESDKDILEQLNKAIENDKKLIYIKPRVRIKKDNKVYQCQGLYQLQLISKYFKEQCAKVGLVPQKTTKIKWPNTFINDNLLNHFLRGYFDGDGSIFYTATKRYVIHLCCKNEGFIDSIREYLKSKNIDSNKQKGNGVFNMSIHRREEQVKFINLIYKDSIIHLARKYDKCQKRLSE